MRNKYLIKFYQTVSTELFTTDFVVCQIIIVAKSKKESELKAKKSFDEWKKDYDECPNRYITKLDYTIETLKDFIDEKTHLAKFYKGKTK